MVNPLLVLDGVGWTYITIFIVWNLSLLSGFAFLWNHRQHPSLPYPFGAVFPCSVEFWAMSILVPLGMALFHASNSQFLHLAARQKHFARMSSLKDHEPIDEKKAQEVVNSRWKRIMNGMERADNIERTLIFIGIGMAVQVALTLFVYFASRKFHSGFGIIDYTVVGTGMEVRMKCSKGWEWWLSIVWQLFWSWVYAPWILFKSRGIRDVHGWRLQTIICCVAGLPASPLWLIGLYTPAFAPMNAVFPPPVWFSVCFCIMEITSIGFPIIDVLKGNKLRQETLDAIANWEARQKSAGLDAASIDVKSTSEYSNTTTLKSGGEVSIGNQSFQSFDSQKSDILTMTALENALRTNAMPLLQFAALKDFSGENVSFLTHVADWRLYWFSPKASIAEHRRRQFLAATRIYAHFISLEFSEFPINISSKEMKLLHMVFERTANLLFGRRRNSESSSVSDATPFDNVMPDDASDLPINVSAKSNHLSPNAISLDKLGRANLRAVSRMGELYDDESVADVEVPDAFNELVFDAAEKEIKYLVLTNTWPKFVNVSRANSQLTRDADEEKGNAWMRRFLCA
ncbi:hypothetical protein J4E85_000882 [Alternaria conjuncta]|uniref:uncharacterized protein n=1 Tax=Alternaria conjuncta TaxID=181017 RepID=UPI00221F792D|nr:uncharacterized protein J4E85_000882 [Alternaria conjuncta]KAI4938442.1 hypothetical protein J4E85_000882 [Alternaria conjuncta]